MHRTTRRVASDERAVTGVELIQNDTHYFVTFPGATVVHSICTNTKKDGTGKVYWDDETKKGTRIKSLRIWEYTPQGYTLTDNTALDQLTLQLAQTTYDANSQGIQSGRPSVFDAKPYKPLQGNVRNLPRLIQVLPIADQYALTQAWLSCMALRETILWLTMDRSNPDKKPKQLPKLLKYPDPARDLLPTKPVRRETRLVAGFLNNCFSEAWAMTPIGARLYANTVIVIVDEHLRRLSEFIPKTPEYYALNLARLTQRHIKVGCSAAERYAIIHQPTTPLSLSARASVGLTQLEAWWMLNKIKRTNIVMPLALRVAVAIDPLYIGVEKLTGKQAKALYEQTRMALIAIGAVPLDVLPPTLDVPEFVSVALPAQRLHHNRCVQVSWSNQATVYRTATNYMGVVNGYMRCNRHKIASCNAKIEALPQTNTFEVGQPYMPGMKNHG